MNTKVGIMQYYQVHSPQHSVYILYSSLIFSLKTECLASWGMCNVLCSLHASSLNQMQRTLNATYPNEVNSQWKDEKIVWPTRKIQAEGGHP